MPQESSYKKKLLYNINNNETERSQHQATQEYRNSSTTIASCPEEFAKFFCLNGATCFSVQIKDSTLYNCWCPLGFHGLRCDYKYIENKASKATIINNDSEQDHNKTTITKISSNFIGQNGLNSFLNSSGNKQKQQHYGQRQKEAIISHDRREQQKQSSYNQKDQLHLLIIYNLLILLLAVTLLIIFLINFFKRKSAPIQSSPTSSSMIAIDQEKGNNQDEEDDQDDDDYLEYYGRRRQHDGITYGIGDTNTDLGEFRIENENEKRIRTRALSDSSHKEHSVHYLELYDYSGGRTSTGIVPVMTEDVGSVTKLKQINHFSPTVELDMLRKKQMTTNTTDDDEPAGIREQVNHNQLIFDDNNVDGQSIATAFTTSLCDEKDATAGRKTAQPFFVSKATRG